MGVAPARLLNCARCQQRLRVCRRHASPCRHVGDRFSVVSRLRGSLNVGALRERPTPVVAPVRAALVSVTSGSPEQGNATPLADTHIVRNQPQPMNQGSCHDQLVRRILVET